MLLSADASKGAYVSGFDQPSEKGKEKAPTEKVRAETILRRHDHLLTTAGPLL